VRYTPTTNAPVGTRRKSGLVTRDGGGRIESWDVPVFSDADVARGAELLAARSGDDGPRIDRRTAARRLTMQVSRYADLEAGRTRLPDDQHAEALSLLRRAP
jgi:hypothetical protein